jgi:hypothetical protein
MSGYIKLYVNGKLKASSEYSDRVDRLDIIGGWMEKFNLINSIHEILIQPKPEECNDNGEDLDSDFYSSDLLLNQGFFIER